MCVCVEGAVESVCVERDREVCVCVCTRVKSTRAVPFPEGYIEKLGSGNEDGTRSK